MRTRTMKQFCALVFASFCALLTCCPGMALAERATDEVLVTYEEQRTLATQSFTQTDDALAPQIVESRMAELGCEVTQEVLREDDTVCVVVQLPEGTNTEDAMVQLEAIDGVESVQPNYTYHVIEPTLMQSVAAQASEQPNLVAARVPQAWSVAQTNHAISVAVVDTGCRLTHEDLVANVDAAHAWNYWGGGDEGQPLTADTVAYNGDDNGHGTHVCGIIGAQAQNGVGIDGASHDANLIPLKAANSIGVGYTSDLLRAIKYARTLKKTDVPNLRVINISMGGDEYDCAFEDAVQDAAQEGILVVCSAGNNANEEAMYPSDYPCVLSVMALDEDESFASYTSFNDQKDIAAVGTAKSAYRNSDTSYTVMSGTSMSAPLVSGIAALVWSVNPNMSVAQVRDVLLSTTQDAKAGNSNYDTWVTSLGKERVQEVDAAAAVNRANELYGGAGIIKRSVARPSATNYLYDGDEHVGVPSGAGYTLSDGGIQKNAGSYVTIATLEEGYEWDDGTTETLELEWSISKAPLTVAFKTQMVEPDTPWDQVEPQFTYKGLVGNDADTLDLTFSTLPTVQKPDDYEEGKSTPNTVWELMPSGVEAPNYEVTSVAGKLIVGANGAELRSVPRAQRTFAYDGYEHAPVAAESWYTLGGDYAKTFACRIRTDDAGEPLTGSNRYETYKATLSLVSADDYWDDGTRGSKTIAWKITKAPLSLTYKESWVLVGGTIPYSVDKNLEIKGFVNGEKDVVLADPAFKLPTLMWANYAEQEGGVPLTSERERELVSKRGDYDLIPDPHRDVEGNEYNATNNYEFTLFSPGVLHVCEPVDVSWTKSTVYTGLPQRGVAPDASYVVSGQTDATDVGTYQTSVSPRSGYLWRDGTNDKRTFTWRISPASIGEATVSAIDTQAYTGSALTPKPTVTWKGRTLKNDKDYVLTYANNLQAGTATVRIQGKGNFGDVKTVTFTIDDTAYKREQERKRLLAQQRAQQARDKAAALSVRYRVRLQKRGWQGWKSAGTTAGTAKRGLRLEALRMRLRSAPYSGGIRYRVRVQGIGWQSWKANGATAGTVGRSRRMEAVRVRLTGAMAKRYDVWYRVRVKGFGWMGWTKNGANAGSVGYKRRLEALQVRILPKGSKAPGRTAGAFRRR